MFEKERLIIEEAWERRELLGEESTREVIRRVVEAVDKGVVRCAEPIDLENSKWQVNEWVKKAIIMYFPIQTMRTMTAGELEWYDKMELKHDFESLGVRVVPHAVARYGAYIAYKGKNYRIPRGKKAELLSYADCLNIVNNTKK